MKKLIILIVLSALLFLTGCTKEAEVPDVEVPDVEVPDVEVPDVEVPDENEFLTNNTASEILNSIILESGLDFSGYETLIDEDNIANILGSTDYPEFSDSSAYLPMINIDVSLLVVLRVTDIDKVEETVDALYEHLDPYKLICVSYTFDDVVIRQVQDIVVLIINKTYKTELDEAFTNLISVR